MSRVPRKPGGPRPRPRPAALRRGLAAFAVPAAVLLGVLLRGPCVVPVATVRPPALRVLADEPVLLRLPFAPTPAERAHPAADALSALLCDLYRLEDQGATVRVELRVERGCLFFAGVPSQPGECRRAERRGVAEIASALQGVGYYCYDCPPGSDTLAVSALLCSALPLAWAGTDVVSVPIERLPVGELVTFAIKTLERPACMERAVRSIAALYPDAPIVVADDSRNTTVPVGPWWSPATMTYLPLDYDVGVGIGRNALFDAVSTPLVFYLDDDMYVEPGRIDLAHLASAILNHGYDMVSGTIAGKTGYYGTLRDARNARGDPVLYLDSADHGERAACKIVDMCGTYWLGRTVALRGAHPPQLKTAEHEALFHNLARAGRTVGICPGSEISHAHDCGSDSDAYQQLRWRTRFQKDSLKEMGIARIVKRWPGHQYRRWNLRADDWIPAGSDGGVIEAMVEERCRRQ